MVKPSNEVVVAVLREALNEAYAYIANSEHAVIECSCGACTCGKTEMQAKLRGVLCATEGC